MFSPLSLLSGNRKYLFGLMLLVVISVFCVFFGTGDKDGFEIARREIMLRKLGDELLSQSGDNTSRVLPVQRVSETEYHVSFEKELSFSPDSLVEIVRRLRAGDPLAGDYVVNVLNAADKSVAYGFAISRTSKNDVIACMGRRQPKASYIVGIKLKPAGINTVKGGYLLGGLSFLAFMGLVFFRSGKMPVETPAVQSTGLLLLGTVSFDPKKRQLTINGTVTDLTDTESRILFIFAQNPNEIIERSRLQKEIWEDEGVIVGRSLDMFISKLRKKLESDPAIRIVVIRGKGYRLEIGG